MAETRPASLDAFVTGGGFAFIAGFADATTFVGADGVFCAHVTGNFVVLAADLAHHADAEEWLKLATLPIFVASVLATLWISRRSQPAFEAATVRRLVASMAAMLSVAAVVGMTATASRPGTARTAIVALLVAAMGIQNALHRLHPMLGVMTTVMTGNVTQWLAGLFMPKATPDASKRRAAGVVIALFAIGCVSGACGVVRLGFGVLAVPAAVALLARSRIR